MEREAVQRLPQVDASILASRRALLQGIFFVLVWPAFNLLFLSLVLLELGYFDRGLFSTAALQLFAVFTIAYGLILLLQRSFDQFFPEERFWPQLALHLAVFFTVGQFFEPVLSQTQLNELPMPSAPPVVLMLFQVTLYVLVKTLITQREHYLAMQLNLRQAQINVLRSQTNPHFLFNTLNLLASQISRDPATAREIVYDLADLLRESMQAAEREFISLDEEVRLASLYLELQKKRFPDRLDFYIDVDAACRGIAVPSLILQPVVENAVKHVVSRSTDLTTLRICAHTRDNELLIDVQDDGQKVDTSALKNSGGLRIVRETLALHYNGRADMLFESTDAGGRVTISLPLQHSATVT